MLSASVGRHNMDPLSVSGVCQGWPVREIDLARLRIGTVEDFGACAVDPSIRRSFRQRVAALARHTRSCEPVALSLPDGHRCFDILRAESFVAAFADTYRQDPQSLGPNVRANVEMAHAITLGDRAWAHLEQTRIARRFERAFEQVDLIVAPVTPVSPFPWSELYAERIDGQEMRNYYEWLGLTYMVTLATNPALSLPCGVDEQGMPFGLQLVAPLRADDRLLAMASAIEAAFAMDAELCRPRPPEAVLAQAQPTLKSLVTHPPLFEGAAPATAASDTAV
jgi:Asp-tRNA(Asn)/Glu-tRNA(Gln) amidotransferase A subunit family amidase